jgi:hypothetical protein
MWWGSFGLDGVRTASFEGVPLPLVDRLAWSTRASGVGNFSDRFRGVSRDPPHRSSATILTSNRDPVEWLALMADPLLAQSAVDRLKSAAHKLVLEGESYRHRQKPGLEADGEHTSNPRGATKARR